MIVTQTYLSVLHELKGYKVKPLELSSGDRIHDNSSFFGETTDGKYVIKLANPISNNNSIMIENEIELLSSLEHESIIKYIDSGLFEMEYLTGEKKLLPFIVLEKFQNDLSDFLKQKKNQLEVEHIFKIMNNITSAVCYLHEQNIVHGDIRPDNILLNIKAKDVEVKLCDFGHARNLNKYSLLAKELTILNEFSPPDTILTMSFDVYSLGVLLHKLTNENSFFIKSYGISDEFSFFSNIPIYVRRDLELLIKEATNIIKGSKKIDSKIFDERLKNIFENFSNHVLGLSSPFGPNLN